MFTPHELSRFGQQRGLSQEAQAALMHIRVCPQLEQKVGIGA